MPCTHAHRFFLKAKTDTFRPSVHIYVISGHWKLSFWKTTARVKITPLSVFMCGLESHFFWLVSSVWCKGWLLCGGAIPLVFPHRCWLTPTRYISSTAVCHYRLWVSLERLGAKVARGSDCQFYSDPCPDLAFFQGHRLNVCFALLPSSWHPSVQWFTAPLLWRVLDIAGQPAFAYSFGQNLFWNTVSLHIIFWKPEEKQLSLASVMICEGYIFFFSLFNLFVLADFCL